MNKGDKNNYGMTKLQMEKKYHLNLNDAKRAFLNKHIHWLDNNRKCRICKKFVINVDMELIERELYGMPKLSQ